VTVFMFRIFFFSNRVTFLTSKQILKVTWLF